MCREEHAEVVLSNIKAVSKSDLGGRTSPTSPKKESREVMLSELLNSKWEKCMQASSAP